MIYESHVENISMSALDIGCTKSEGYFLTLVARNIKYRNPPVLKGFAELVVSALIERTGSFTMEIQDVADDLGVEVDEIKYRLKVDGEGFKDLRKQVRRHLAIKYLLDGVSIEKISCDLGYSDRESFSAFFKVNTGFPPNKFKKYYFHYSKCLGGARGICGDQKIDSTGLF